MLVPFADVLGEADARGAACGAFTCYDLETAAAVLGTAARMDRAVLLLVSPSSLRGADGSAFVAALLAYADRAPARCCVQADHLDDLELVRRALELGVGAVLADGSRLPLEANVAFVRSARDLALRSGAGVEAELGRIEGDEDLALAAGSGQLTEPDEATRFVAETGIDCLAVSIGNAHGRYAAPPRLDWDRLRAVRAQVDAPLALHGASGIPDESIRHAVALGLRKINVNTELREAYLRATAASVDALLETAAVGALHSAQTRAVADIVAAKLAVYEPGDIPMAPAIDLTRRHTDDRSPCP
jgi:ketose-bisphosphate aldolase